VTKEIKNVAASVRAHLLNLARERNEDFNLVLTKYALERMLYRISQSPYKAIFILKGALLFELWTDQRYRPTRDADFLSRGDSDPVRFQEIFKELCAIAVEDDGLVFDPATVTAERIKENADYEGVRVNFTGLLEKARIAMQMDIGFGDAITPEAVEATFPVMLDLPAPVLFTYPRETAIAEKFEAMVKLGIANSRMKDFHDVRALARLFGFEGAVLSEAIKKTFERRGTAIPTTAAPPTVFTPEFFDNKSNRGQWQAFVNKNSRYVEPISLQELVADIERFLMPLIAPASGEDPAGWTWPAGGPWSKALSRKQE
jgi:Nucleotidyl transferase AbiEii toxin, Type IV TA system